MPNSAAIGNPESNIGFFGHKLKKREFSTMFESDQAAKITQRKLTKIISNQDFFQLCVMKQVTSPAKM